VTKKHAPQYFICSLNFKSHNFQTESYLKHVTPTCRGSTTFTFLVLQPCLTLWTYLDDLVCISKNCLEDHLEKLDKILRQLHDAGLKVNAEKLTFCALEIECWGYILTRDGIKPQSNKVQAILAIQLPKGVKQLRHFLAWYNTTVTSGHDGAICLPLSSYWLESAVRQK
jgi:hypothetical protein